ncbi:MAG TPA: cupredoxin domain-containing protein [Solirubrobacteraceae bacterium]
MRPVFIVVFAFVVAAVVAAALALSHGGGRSATGAAPVAGDETIDISNFAYSPASVRVEVGTTITFKNEESVEHTATSNANGLFDTGTLEKGQSVRLKMNKVGTFSFHCSFHAFMHGTIKVVPR